MHGSVSSRIARSGGVLAIVAVSLVGCRGPGIIFEPPDPPLFWPPPPAQPRIHYVGAIATDADLEPAVTFGQWLFGREPTRSMLSPFAVVTDDGSRLFVCDSNAQAVHVFDLEDRTYQQWRPDDGATPFAQPVGLAFGGNGPMLAVADPMAGVISLFDADGVYKGVVGRGEVTRPCGLSFGPTGRLFVADAGTHEVVVFTPDGRVERRFGERGSGPGQFNYPISVAVGATGQVYVSDSLNARVQVFDPAMGFLLQIGSKGDGPGYFSQPKGLAVDRDEHLYVVDAHFELVQVFDAEGQLLMSFGQEGHGPGEFWLPAGIHVDARNRIWVADSYNRRVQVFDYRPEDDP